LVSPDRLANVNPEKEGYPPWKIIIPESSNAIPNIPRVVNGSANAEAQNSLVLLCVGLAA
jgi:hypothetical protein